MGKIVKRIYYAIVIFRNIFVNKIPSRTLRKNFDLLLGAKIGKDSVINRKCEIINPRGLRIGKNCAIGWDCQIDARGGVDISNNVVIASGTKIITGTHIVDSENFQADFKKVIIKDRAWIATGVIICPGVTVGEGSVVAAGSVVVKDVDDYTVVGGNPAKFIRYRNNQLKYTIPKTPPLH